MIDACQGADAGRPELYAGGGVYIGNDIARSKHLWAAAALELVGNILWTREISVLKDKSFEAQDRRLDEMVAYYRMVRLWMDRTGMGMKPAEDAARRYGESRVHGVNFSPGTKLDLATALKRQFEDRSIVIPEGDVALRADLHSVQRIAGPAGIRLLADDKADGHADRFWALALAAAAAASLAGPFAGETDGTTSAVLAAGFGLGEGSGPLHRIDAERGVVLSPTASELDFYG